MNDKCSNFLNNYYPICLQLVLKYFKYLKNSVVIDVGSNIGLFAKSIAETIPYSHIHLFEPSNEYLNESKKLLNDFSNITFNNFGLSDVKNELTLYKSSDSNIGWNTLYTQDPLQDEAFLSRMNTEIVKVVRLDDYYQNIDRIDFIKIDVEGFERNVLEGSWELIKKFKPYILVEVAWGKNHPDWDLNKKTYEKLFSLGYEPVDLDSIEKTQDVLFKPTKKLPISIGMISWNSNQTLRNTLKSYQKNGLFDIIDDFVIFFQEVSEEDKKIAEEFKIPFIGSSENIGIGRAFFLLANHLKNDYILLLEHDWELVENLETTYNRLKTGINFLNEKYHCIRYRHRKKPGYPLYTLQCYVGNELNHYDSSIDLVSPHLLDCIHWIEEPHHLFSDKIKKKKDWFETTSRWANFTNNPCLYKKDFYINTISKFKDKGNVLEDSISYWWARQDFKVVCGEGLFTHNDFEKYGITKYQ